MEGFDAPDESGSTARRTPLVIGEMTDVLETGLSGRAEPAGFVDFVGVGVVLRPRNSMAALCGPSHFDFRASKVQYRMRVQLVRHWPGTER